MSINTLNKFWAITSPIMRVAEVTFIACVGVRMATTVYAAAKGMI